MCFCRNHSYRVLLFDINLTPNVFSVSFVECKCVSCGDLKINVVNKTGCKYFVGLALLTSHYMFNNFQIIIIV